MKILKIPDTDFIFRKCTIQDIDDICKIQELAFQALTDSNLLRRNSKEVLQTCLEEPHYTLGVFHKEKLIAFAILYDGGNTDENIGRDIEIPEEKLSSVVNFKLVIVLPEYRGNKLQQKLIYKLEEIAKENGKKIMCATISPLNSFSLKNFEDAGFKFHSQKIKYNNLKRCIYYKKLG